MLSAAHERPKAMSSLLGVMTEVFPDPPARPRDAEHFWPRSPTSPWSFRAMTSGAPHHGRRGPAMDRRWRDPMTRRKPSRRQAICTTRTGGLDPSGDALALSENGRPP
jgi:hypothetical protein